MAFSLIHLTKFVNYAGNLSAENCQIRWRKIFCNNFSVYTLFQSIRSPRPLASVLRALTSLNAKFSGSKYISPSIKVPSLEKENLYFSSNLSSLTWFSQGVISSARMIFLIHHYIIHMLLLNNLLIIFFRCDFLGPHFLSWRVFHLLRPLPGWRQSDYPALHNCCWVLKSPSLMLFSINSIIISIRWWDHKLSRRAKQDVVSRCVTLANTLYPPGWVCTWGFPE